MRIIKLIFVIFLLVNFSVIGFASNKVIVALDWYINPDHAPLLVADSMGFFKKHNVDVSFITPTEMSAPSELVAEGKADIAVVYEPQLIAQLADGMPLKGIGVLINKALCCIAVLKDSDIKNLSDLKDKSIGYAGDGTNHAILGTMLSTNHVALNQIKLVNTQMNLSQALLSRKVDAIYGMMRNVEPVQLEQMGIGVRLFYPENNGVPMYSELMFAANKSHASDKKISNFLEGVKDGVEYLKKHPEKSWKIVIKNYKNSLAMTSQMEQTNYAIWKATVPYFASDPNDINKKQFDNFALFLCKKGTISKNAYKKVFDM